MFSGAQFIWGRRHLRGAPGLGVVSSPDRKRHCVLGLAWWGEVRGERAGGNRRRDVGELEAGCRSWGGGCSWLGPIQPGSAV